jgi:hypothetical protein
MSVTNAVKRVRTGPERMSPAAMGDVRGASRGGLQKLKGRKRICRVALVIDGLSVVIANSAVEARFPGGLTAYARAAPDSSFSTDGRICGVRFSSEADARGFVERLARHGFPAPWSGPCDVALIAVHVSALYPCEWLDLTLQRVQSGDGRRYLATVARLRGDCSTPVEVPDGWQPAALHRLTASDLPAEYQLVDASREHREQVETYRHRPSGRLVRISRPAE